MYAFRLTVFALFTAGLMGIVAALAEMASGRLFDVVAIVAFWIAVPLWGVAIGAGGWWLLREGPAVERGWFHG